MFPDPLTDAELKARIDTPDFAEALAADENGGFHTDIATYLSAWNSQLKSCQDAGLPPGEFDALSRLSDSIRTSRRVLEFFVKLQKLPAAQASEN